jgi:hypothetical protein
MSGISGWIYDLFGSNEELILVFIFVIFLIDALVFPTLPELFLVLSFNERASLALGVELLLIIIAAELLGVAALYYVVGKVRIPKRIERAITKYVDFLVLGDERLVLLNRIAPMIPFCGAFIRVMKWDIKKSLMYVVIGCVAKYGIILLMSKYFQEYFEGDMALWCTIIFVFAIIGASFILSVFYKKKNAVT